MTNGLAWSADDTKLYAVLVTPRMPFVFSLQIIDNAVSSAVRLTGPSGATYGTPVTVTGKIKAGSISNEMAAGSLFQTPNALLAITRKRYGPGPRLL